MAQEKGRQVLLWCGASALLPSIPTKRLEPSSKEAIIDSAVKSKQCYSLMSSAFGQLHNGAVVKQAALISM